MDIEKLSFHTKQILKTYKEAPIYSKPLYPEFYNKIHYILKSIVINTLTEQISYWNKYGIRVESTNEFEKCIHILPKQQLGQGAFGVVYKVPVKTCIKNIPIGIKDVVVKVENLNLNNLNHTPEKLKETISITKTVAELNIGPKLYDVFIVKLKNQYKIIKIYEYIEGTNWNAYKFKSTSEHKKAITTLKNYIHIINKNGIIHNDLHSENVMISKTGRIYIIDFDFASYSDNIERNNIINFYDNDYIERNDIDICTNYVYNELIKRKIIKIPKKTYKK